MNKHSPETVEQENRRRLGYLQQVFRIAGEDPSVQEYLDQQIHAVLVYARLKGHDVQDWSEPT